ncbi:MAG TPA: NAD-dependent epimerase/dehydratase family protein [Spirochaetota bacterium]|nr:NAD-dependent epimerase/dehydratase family protein [Spirochaetota bacterium]
MKVLFIGGTGIISSASSALAVERGIDLYHLTRGKSSEVRPVKGVTNIIADIHDEEGTRKALAGHVFDAVVEWIAFEPSDIERDIRLFRGITSQYVFISSASIYETPPSRLPVTEDTPLYNPVWKYSQSKIACEDLLRAEWRRERFPYTIVRPSHTYDKTLVPIEGGYTVLERMKLGKPVVVHGDGSSLWTLTHHRDFAKGLVGLLGNPDSIAEAFHITSDEFLSWDAIHRVFAAMLGVDPRIVHIPSEVIAKYDRAIGDSLLGDKTHSMIFDNSKIRSFVPDFDCVIPFTVGAKEIVDYYDGEPSRRAVDRRIDQLFDRMIDDYQK